MRARLILIPLILCILSVSLFADQSVSVIYENKGYDDSLQKFGFTYQDNVSGFDDVVEEADKLELSDNGGDRFTVKVEGTVNVFWQFMTSKNLVLKLSLSGPLSGIPGEVDYLVSWEEKKGASGTSVTDHQIGKGDYGAEAVVFSHVPSESVGSYGVVPLSVDVEDVSTLQGGEFSASLILNIVDT